MSTDWVAKMLKFGGVKTPSFDWIGKDGTIYPNAVYGSIIKNKPYENLDYGKNYKPDSKHLMQDFTHVDVPCVKPDDLTFNREQLLALKGNSKKPFSGCVEGEIYYSKIVEDALMHNKENNFFYEKFGSYEILSTQALALEAGMQRIVLGPSILVKGQLIRGKEFGQWHFRYKRKDMDFLLMTAQYKNGKLDGTAKFYKPDGRLYQECEFEKGKLVMRIWYNIEGKIISKEYYEDENLIRTEEFERKPYFYGI